MRVDKKVIYLQIQVFVSRNYQKECHHFSSLWNQRLLKEKKSCFVVFLMLAQGSCPLWFFVYLYVRNSVCCLLWN